MAQITIIAKNNSIVVNGLQCEKGRLSIAVSDDTILVNNLNGTLSEVTINGNSYSTMQEFVDAADELLFEYGGGAPGEGVQSVTGDLVNNADARNPVVNLPTDVLRQSDTTTAMEADKIPLYSAQGLLSTGEPQYPENAVNLAYLQENVGRYLGLHETVNALETAHPTANTGDRAEVRDVDSTGDIHRWYYWGEMAGAWLPLNKSEDDVYTNGEAVTNKIWINGKKIYRRVLHNEVIEDDGSVLISLAGVGITEITHFDYTVNENGTLRKSVDSLDISVTNTSLTITPTGVPSVPTSVSIVLEYTK